MTITRRDLAGLAIVTVAAASAAEAVAQAANRRSEVDALRTLAETIHPRGREAAADAEWIARWRALAAEADTLSDGAYIVRTRQALGWLKDGHTTVLPFEFTGGVPAQLARGPFSLNLPIGVRVFHDGAYVTSAKGAGEALLGAQIARIGAKNVVDLMRAWATNWPGNDAWAHRWAGAILSPAFLQALGAVTDPSAPVAVQATIGRQRVNAVLRPSADAGADLQPMQRTKTSFETWSQEAGAGNYVRREGQAIYVSCDDLSVEADAFRAFSRACVAAMEDASATRLILDLRRNGGGDNYLFEPLRKYIERSRFNRLGKLYVLISPQTFSAAQNAVNRLERETFALFVGEPTGGAPNHYGDGRVTQHETTGIMSLVSTLPWFDSYPQDKRTWIMPDLPAPALFADWRDGKDPALQLALSHADDTPPDDWADVRTFFFNRPSQANPWRPFWRPAS